ncbi:MAG: thiolase family protein [Anaerolineaceae bacterium]|nr:thiolase family protein [Anaerolineaceae bacterium]
MIDTVQRSASRLPVVVAVGMTPFAAHHADKNARDLTTDAVLACMQDAGLENLNQVEHGITSYESDHFNRQMTMGAILHDQVGMIPKPNLRVEGGGATGALALRTARAYLLSGMCDSVLVYGCELNGRSVSSQTANQLFALSADVDWEVMLGGTYTGFYAAMMRAHMEQYGTKAEQFAHVAVRNRRNAARNPLAQKPLELTIDEVLNSRMIADPYRLLDCSLLSDGAAAILLSTRDWAEAHSERFAQRPPIHFSASGCGTDTMRLGDRFPNITNFAAKKYAAEMAYEQLGITEPKRAIDLAECYDSYSGAELQSMEDLGFAKRGQGGPAIAAGEFDADGILPVNPSGGLLGRGAPVGATGIAQAIEICLQLWGEAGERQVYGAQRGLTDTHAGIGSICVVNVWEQRG